MQLRYTTIILRKYNTLCPINLSIFFVYSPNYTTSIVRYNCLLKLFNFLQFNVLNMIIGSLWLIIMDSAACFNFSSILNISEDFLCHSSAAKLLKQNRIPPTQLSLIIHICESMRYSSLGTMCHRDEDLLLRLQIQGVFWAWISWSVNEGFVYLLKTVLRLIRR